MWQDSLFPSLRIVLLVFCLRFFQFWVVHLGFFMELHQWQSRKCSISVPLLPWNTCLYILVFFYNELDVFFVCAHDNNAYLNSLWYVLHLALEIWTFIAHCIFFLWACKSIIGYSQLLNQFLWYKTSQAGGIDIVPSHSVYPLPYWRSLVS